MKSSNPIEDRELPPELAGLFASYREALPEPEPTRDFIPGMWARIDARRKDTWTFGRLTRGFVTASGVICLMLSAAMWIPEKVKTPSFISTYVDVLANDTAADEPLDAELVR